MSRMLISLSLLRWQQGLSSSPLRRYPRHLSQHLPIYYFHRRFASMAHKTVPASQYPLEVRWSKSSLDP
jgi:hypothetical protein